MSKNRLVPLVWMAAGAALVLIVPRLVPSVQAQQQPPAPVPDTPVQSSTGESGGNLAVVTRGGGGVYVLRGNTVYLLDAASLDVLRQTQLPPPDTRFRRPAK